MTFYKVLKIAILWVLFIVSFPRLSPGHISANVPLNHWSYEAIERLTASGNIGGVMLNKRPLSRIEMAEILSKISRTVPISSRILRQDIRRLVDEYKNELQRLGILPVTDRLVWYRIADPISWEIIYADTGESKRTPRENHWGEYFYDGISHRLLFRTWANLKDYIVIDIAPRFSIYTNYQDVVFQEAYVKTSFSNIKLEIGRDSIWWGPGYHGSLILSNNAQPFNLVKIESHRPFSFPGWLRVLGLWDISAFLTQLEADRDFPEARLFGLRVGVVPFKFMEISLTRSIIFGGKGRQVLDPSDYMKIFFAIGENSPGKLDNNQLAGMDVRIAIPAKKIAEGFSIYGQLIGEDEAGGLPSSYGFLGGVFICDLFNMGFFDIRIEYAEHPILEEDVPLYRHHIYTKGYTYNSRVIGHPIGGFEDDYFSNGVFEGSDAWDVFFRIILHAGKYVDIGLQYDYERHRMFEPIRETKEEMAIDISGRLTDKVLLNIGQEYERIDNWRGIRGKKIDNYYLWGRVEITY